MLNMPSTIKRDLRLLSKGDLIKVINLQHNDVMLKNEQIEEAFAQVEQIREMSTKLKNEYEIDLACARLSNLCAQNAIASASNGHVIDEDGGQEVHEELEALKREIEGLEQNNRTLEQEVIRLKLTAKRNKFEGITGVTHQNKSAEIELGTLETLAKKAGVEILVIMDRRNGCYPVKRRFADLTRSVK